MPWIPAVVGAVGAVGAGISALSDGDQGADDIAQQKIWDQQAADDKQARDNDFQYGGKVGGAKEEADRLKLLGANAGNQAWTKPDYAGGDKYSGLGDQSRTSQQDALGMMRSAAQGGGPSQAAIMMNQGNDQAMANNLSMAAGARGPAAMAMAQQQAMANQSAMSTNNMNNMGALRANEMAQARGAYGNMATGMRGQDLQNQQAMDARTQFGGNLELQRRALMQQGQMGYEGMAQGVNRDQLGARMGKQGADEGHWQAQMHQDEQSKKDSQDLGLGLANTGASVLGHAAELSDVRVKDGVVFEGIGRLKKTGGK